MTYKGLLVVQSWFNGTFKTRTLFVWKVNVSFIAILPLVVMIVWDERYEFYTKLPRKGNLPHNFTLKVSQNGPTIAKYPQLAQSIWWFGSLRCHMKVVTGILPERWVAPGPNISISHPHLIVLSFWGWKTLQNRALSINTKGPHLGFFRWDFSTLFWNTKISSFSMWWTNISDIRLWTNFMVFFTRRIEQGSLNYLF